MIKYITFQNLMILKQGKIETKLKLAGLLQTYTEK
jgi:hypothetical protein